MTNLRLHTLIMPSLALALLAGCRSAHTTSAILYIDEQDYQKAVDVIDEGLSYDPDDAEAYFWQGEAYSHMAEKAIIDNDYVKARESYDRAYEKYTTAREMDPELTDQVEESLEISYNNRLRDGERMWQGDYVEQAEGFFRLAFAAWPDSATPLRNIANMKMSLAASATEDTTARALMGEALTFLDEFIEREPDVYQARADKAYVLTYLDRLDEAEAMYDELLQTQGDNPELLADVVGFARQRQDYRRAADLNVKIADLYAADAKPENDDKVVPLLTDAGNWYASRDVEAYPEALSALERAGRLDPADPDLLFYRLRTYFFYGQDLEEKAETAAEPQAQASRDQARQMFAAGVEVGNQLVGMAEHAEGYRYLALCQGRLGDAAGAEQNMARYQQLIGGS